MSKNVYSTVMDGIPGIMPGNVIPIPEPMEVGSAEYMPVKMNLPNDYEGSNAVKTLNRRMMQK